MSATITEQHETRSNIINIIVYCCFHKLDTKSYNKIIYELKLKFLINFDKHTFYISVSYCSWMRLRFIEIRL